MFVTSPSQYVRTRSSSSSSKSRPSSCSPSTPSSSHTHILTNLGGLINKYPAGLGLGPRRSSTSSPKQSTSTSSVKHPQRPSVLLPYNNRTAPPPPQFRPSRTPSRDPFLDENEFDPTRTVIYDSQQELRSRHWAPCQGPPAEVPTQVASAPDRDSRSKLVAGILLHRVHAVGKPIRKTAEVRDGPRTYVRSGLSRTVSVECY